MFRSQHNYASIYKLRDIMLIFKGIVFLHVDQSRVRVQPSDLCSFSLSCFKYAKSGHLILLL